MTEADESASKFETACRKCEELLASIRDGREPRNSLETAKDGLKELESLLDEAERSASTSEVNRKVNEGRARNFRKRYNDLMQGIMHEDNPAGYDLSEPTTGLRRTSDLIFGEDTKKLKDADKNTDLDGCSSEEFEDIPEEVEEIQRNNNLEKHIMIGTCAVFVVFLIAYMVIHYLF